MRYTLLLAMSDDVGRRELFQTFSNRGLFVVEASSPDQVMARLNCFYPDAILLDLKTSKENLDVYKKIRKVSNCPIILVLPDRNKQVQVEMHKAGVEHLLFKPLDIQALFVLIKRLVANKNSISMKDQVERDELNMKTYYTQGVCATEIHFKIRNHVLVDVKFEGGCQGNLHAISTLIKGMKVEDVICKLRGISCESNPTSCVDQLTKALEEEIGYSPKCIQAS